MQRFLPSLSRIVLLTLFATRMIAAESQGEGVIFYAPLERHPLKATYAKGLSEGSGEGFLRTSGPGGRAIRTGPDGLSFPMLGNFEHTRGTLAFWVKLLGEKAGQPATVDIFEAVNFMLRYDATRNLLMFMTGASIHGKGFEWSYACAASPKNKLAEWTHVVATWDAERGQRALYFDGVEVASAESELMRKTMHGEDNRIRFGKKGQPPVFVDEIIIWNRVLPKDVIAGLRATDNTFAEAVEAMAVRESDEKPFSVGLSPGSSETSILAPGESYAVAIPVTNHSRADWSGNITLTLLDFWEEEKARYEKEVEIPAGATVNIEHSFAGSEQGIFKVGLAIEEPETYAEAASFVVWPPGSRLSDESFFGLHVNSWSDEIVAQAARLGFRWNRNHNMLQTTWWPRVQPEPGEFQWLHDESLARNEKHGFRVLGQFFGTPYWAAAGGPLKPQKVSASDSPYPYGARPEMEPYREYVKQTVRRYKDRIRFWETGNEPDVSRFWNGSPEQFAELAQVTYDTVKAEDPTAEVMLAGFAPGWPWVRRAAEAGAFRAADTISFHLYHSPTIDMEDFATRAAETVAFYRDLIEKHGRHPDMPLWQTEGGSGSTTWLRGIRLPKWPPEDVLPEMNWREAALNQVKAEVILESLGFVRSFTYLWNPSSRFGDLTELDINRTPKPKMITRAVLAHAVDNADFVDWVDHAEGRLRLAVYEKNEGPGSVVVAWAANEGVVEMLTEVFGEEAEFHNVMGNPITTTQALRITEEPIFVATPVLAEKLLTDLRAAGVTEIQAPTPKPVREAESGANIPVLPDFASAIEGAQNLFQIDLRPHVNMGFADEVAGDGKGGWSDEGDLNDLKTMTVGPQTFYAVPFDVIDPETNDGKSVITLRGTAVTASLPEAVRGIRVDKKNVRSLYFLHSAAWGEPQAHPIAHYVVHYADGTSLEVPLRIGTETGDWWSGYREGEESRPIAIQVQKTTQRDTGWRYPRIWEWQNPTPDKTIASIDFVSTNGTPTPILVGISGVTW